MNECFDMHMTEDTFISVMSDPQVLKDVFEKVFCYKFSMESNAESIAEKRDQLEKLFL